MSNTIGRRARTSAVHSGATPARIAARLDLRRVNAIEPLLASGPAVQRSVPEVEQPFAARGRGVASPGLVHD
ncbi:MAG TPA: hypothetical protein VMW47_00860 [Verrucomicrobiae bacterium]|nr:hypothetical protein [Verrucomicrobiae bacterium]